MPRFILLVQGHFVYIMQITSFTQITIVNKLTPIYNKSALYTETSPVSLKEAPQVIQTVTLETSTALLLTTGRAC